MVLRQQWQSSIEESKQKFIDRLVTRILISLQFTYYINTQKMIYLPSCFPSLNSLGLVKTKIIIINV